MTDNELKELCRKHGFIAIDLKKEHISIQDIVNIASESTGIDDIEKKTRRQEYSFSRFLAISYLINYYAPAVLSVEFNIDRCTVLYGASLDLMECDIKYLKPWQQYATHYFRDKIKQFEKAKEDEQTKIQTTGEQV